MRSSLRLHAAVVVLFAALAVTYLWPLPAHLGTHYAVRTPGPAGFSADLLFSSWILASDAHRLVHDPLHVFETNNLHPFRHTLAFGENMIGVALLVLPVELLWANPTLTHNVAMLVVLALGGWGTFLLVRELSGNTLAALLAGALVVYSPAVWAEVILLPLLASHWTPVALFLLVRLAQDSSWRTAVFLAVAVAFQVWSSLQHGLFLVLGLTTTATLLVLLGRRARRALPHLATAGVLAGLLCVPLLLPYRAVRQELEVEGRQGGPAYSLTSLDRLAPPVRHPLAYLAARARRGERVQSFAPLAPWVLVAAGAGAAALPGRRRRLDTAALVALAAGGGVDLLFARGPMEHPWLPNLYRALGSIVPGLAWVRVPMRAVSYSYLVLCVLAGCGLAVLLDRFPWRWARGLLATAVLLLIVVEAGWRSVPLAPSPPRTSPLDASLKHLDPACAIAEIPADLNSSGEALFRSTTHWRPLINGFSGFYPVAPLPMYAFLNRFPSPDSVAFLQAAGGCAVVVHPPMAASVLAASQALGLPAELAGSELLVHIPPPATSTVEGPPLPRAHWRVTPESGPASGSVLDGDLETAWRGTVREDAGSDRLTVDLGDTVTISAVALDLGRRFLLYLRTYRVEGSVDGKAWTTLAESPLAVPPLASYRADYRRVRQRIEFPAAAARWLRVRPYRRPPASGLAPEAGWTAWGIAELFAYGMPEMPPASSGALERRRQGTTAARRSTIVVAETSAPRVRLSGQ